MKTTLCKNCILPLDYSGISIDKDGICNYCNNYTAPDYLGENKLQTDVSELLQNSKKKQSKYDCVVGFSGGRDSTYLLWYVVNILNLKPLAVFSNSMLIPQQTLLNVQKTANLLNVDLLIKEHSYLKDCVKHYLKSWSKFPTPATLITLCTGCRLGITKLVYEEAANRHIPLIFAGGTPFEKGYFKKNLISNNGFRDYSFAVGYLKHCVKNPSLVFNIKSVTTLVTEYCSIPKYWNKNYIKNKPFKIEPFLNYFRWEKDEIENIIKNELEWERHPDLASAYRGDCEIGIIRQFLYDKMLGYNDKDDHLSWLIRDNQISREEALKQIKIEKKINTEILIEAFKKLGFNFDEYIAKVEKNARKHNRVDCR